MVHACTAGATASTQAEDAARLLAMINGAWTTQVIRTACALGLPDRLSQRPADALALAAACGCHGDALLRLLRAMAALDLCESVPAGHWRLTGMGRLLCRDASQSLHHWAQHAGSGLWQRLAELPEAVRTGASWPERHHGMGGYQALASDARASEVFHHAMVELTRHATPALVAALELRAVRSVVDVGGGQGALLGAVLRQATEAHGVLLDQAVALRGASALMADWGVADRCRVEEGDFFASVPGGADMYLLKSVLHNWDDEACRRLLARCLEAMSSRARLMVIERVRPEAPGHSTRDRGVARTDLNMLVSLSGRERSLEEFVRLFAAAGLVLEGVREASAEWSVLDVRRGAART